MRIDALRAVLLCIGFGSTVVAASSCGDNGPGNTWLADSKIIVDGYDEDNTDCRDGMICPHNENNDMFNYDGAIYMVHRTAISQVLGPNSSLHIYRSDDGAKTFNLLATLPAINSRDLRDPCFYVINGQLALKALTRLMVNSDRDTAVDTITVGAVSSDKGTTWTPLTQMAPGEWSFWRIREHNGVYYSAAYHEGDTSVSLFSSTDGTNWTQGPVVWGNSEDTPLETELVFMPSGRLLALVRMDGLTDELQGNVGRLRTKVCWSQAPYETFDCPQDLDGVRLDGPNAFFYDSHLYVIARKHFIETHDRKRTALYEITGDLDDGGVLDWKEMGEFPSAGDTSYAGVALIDDNTMVATYYSSNLAQDEAWSLAMFGPTDIWQATVKLDALYP